jgi:hypothetical protein
MKIAVITSCSKNKSEFSGPAWLVNRGQLLRLVIDYSNLINADLFILSAKFGLINADTKIEPYNQKLKTKNDISRIQVQANKKFDQLVQHYDNIIIIMGRFYRSVFYDLSNKKIMIIDDPRGIGGYYQRVVELIKEESTKIFINSEKSEGEIIE